MPMFVVLFTSTGVVFSNQIYIVPNLKENTFLIKTEYNFKSGSEVIIKKLKDTFYEKWKDMISKFSCLFLCLIN